MATADERDRTAIGPAATTGGLAGAPGTTAGRAQAARRIGPLKGIFRFLTPYRGHVALALVFLGLAAASTLGLPIAVRHAIDAALAAATKAAQQSLLETAFLEVFAVAIAVAVCSSLRFYYVSWLGERVTADLRSAVYAQVLTQGPEFFESTPTGEVISRLTADTTLVQTVIGSSFSMGLRNMVMFVGALAILLTSFPRMTLLIVAVVLVITLPAVIIGRRIRKLSRASQDRIADASSIATEIINAIPTVQVEGQVAREANRFSNASNVAFETAVRRTSMRAWLTAFIIGVNFAALLGGLYFGARAVIEGTLSAGELGQAVFLVALLAGSIAVLGEVWGDLLRAAGATERLMELLNAPPAITPPAHPVALPMTPGGLRIAFDQMTFCYPSRTIPALSALTLTIAEGQTVAIVGPSGAGKSTLIQLLLRHYEPQAGAIRVNGCDLAQLDPAELRRNIALVPQDPVVFSASVAENIRYARPDATPLQVEEAARAAQAHAFITALPQGYDTFVGERGLRLSGGQRQRVAIARAILKGAPLLLLDEATSSLDAESEQLVQQALSAAMSGRTTIVVAHRLATVQRADRIIVLDHGRIDDSGTHMELIARGGLYARLAALQLLA